MTTLFSDVQKNYFLSTNPFEKSEILQIKGTSFALNRANYIQTFCFISRSFLIMSLLVWCTFLHENPKMLFVIEISSSIYN